MKSNEELQELVNNLIQNQKLNEVSFEESYSKLQKEEKVKLALAFLQNANQNLDCGKGVAFAFNSFEKEDEATIVSILKQINEQIKADLFPDELNILENIIRIYGGTNCPNSISRELFIRYDKFTFLQQKIPINVFEKEYRKTLECYYKFGFPNILELFQNQFDSNFSAQNVVKYLRASFPLSEDNPYFSFHQKINELTDGESKGWKIGEDQFKNSIKYQAILSSSEEERKNYFMAAIYRIGWANFIGFRMGVTMLIDKNVADFYWIANELIKKKLPFSDEEINFVLEKYLSRNIRQFNITDFYKKNLEKQAKANGVSEALKETLAGIIQMSVYRGEEKKLAKIKQKSEELISKYYGSAEAEEIEKDPYFLDVRGEISKLIQQDLDRMSIKERNVWYDIFRQCHYLESSKPSKRFLKNAGILIEKLGKESFSDSMQKWLNNLKETPYSKEMMRGNISGTIPAMIWFLELIDWENFRDLLEDLAIKFYERIPDSGYRHGKLANACVYILALNRNEEGIENLKRIQFHVDLERTKKFLQKQIDAIEAELEV